MYLLENRFIGQPVHVAGLALVGISQRNVRPLKWKCGNCLIAQVNRRSHWGEIEESLKCQPHHNQRSYYIRQGKLQSIQHFLLG